MKKFYTYEDIILAYKKIGIKKGDVLYVTADLPKLGYFNPFKKILNYHYKALINSIGKDGTISFPTFSYSLVKSRKLFSIKNTPSETGVFTEFLRKRKKSIRQIHPYSSITSLGKFAKFISTNNSKHAHGYDSPFQKLAELDAKFIGIGLEPRYTQSQVHTIETILNVPYRFTKEFIHKVKLEDGKIIKDKFYLYVLYNYLRKIPRDRNKKIFKNFLKKNAIKKSKCGNNYIYSYSMKKFHESTINLMKRDLYVWMRNEPKKKIWKKM